jgi:F-type H+-transporting ATPase subunit b
MSRALVVFTVVFLSAIFVFAAGGEGGHGHIPWGNLIIPQLVNFSIVMGGLIFLLKTPLRNYFHDRAKSFEQLKQKAEAAKAEAERKNSEVRAQLTTLDTTSDKSLEEAKVESQKLRKQIVDEASVQATRIEEESSRMVQHELDRAVAALRTELVTNSVRFAESKIKEKVTPASQDKLNKEFLDKVQAVRV